MRDDDDDDEKDDDTEHADGHPTLPLRQRPYKRLVKWSKDNEDLLVEWADIAQSYRWMTTEAYRHYEYYHMWFTIPIITLSTITGTASFATYSVPNAVREFAPMAIGTVNILVGILSTIQQYLKIAEFKEAYRHAAVSWDKFARNIRIELAKHPDERGDCFSFMKHARIDLDRLTELCPDISTEIVQRFEAHFQDRPGFRDMKKPDICDIMQSVESMRHPHFTKAVSERPRALELETLADLTRKQRPASARDPLPVETQDPQQLQAEMIRSLTTMGRYNDTDNIV